MKMNFKIILLISLILIVTFAAFYPCLNNRFGGWDDDLYITENIVIQDFSLSNVKKIFTSYFVSNYQPLTMLTYLIEYRLLKLDPRGYHLTNLILHLINCLAVFWLIYLLTQKISISSITTLLFGIHPMHVESVAWISERKDLLYALFFLAAIICYYYYLRERKIGRYYFVSLILFIASLLSKAMAITLPLVLFLIDYFTNRKIDRKMFIDKIPFFILSFIFGVVALIGQYCTAAVRSENLFNFFHKVIIASYSIIFYLIKILVPIKLSCLYPYSGLKDIFPYLFSLVAFIILFAIVIVSRKHTKKIIFGSAFFLIAILPILQFVPLGRIIVADRYIYIGSIGIFYILAEGIHWLFISKIKNFRLLQCFVLVILIVLTSILTALTWKRCQVWRDGISLWDNVLNNYPNVALAYNNRGDGYAEQGNIQQAISDFNKAIQIDPNYADAYYNRGNAYLDQGNIQPAIFNYDRAIEINPNYAKAYNRRGNAYLTQGNIQSAIFNYDRALEINPDYIDAYVRRGTIYSQRGNFIQAISDFSRAIQIKPNLVEAYNNRGIAYSLQGNFIQAIFDFNKVIQIKPSVEAYSNRGVFYFLIKEYDQAWKDVHKVEELGYVINPKFIIELKKASGREK